MVNDYSDWDCIRWSIIEIRLEKKSIMESIKKARIMSSSVNKTLHLLEKKYCLSV